MGDILVENLVPVNLEYLGAVVVCVLDDNGMVAGIHFYSLIETLYTRQLIDCDGIGIARLAFVEYGGHVVGILVPLFDLGVDIPFGVGPFLVQPVVLVAGLAVECKRFFGDAGGDVLYFVGE